MKREWVQICDRMPEPYAPVWLAVAGGEGVVPGHADGERWRTEGLDDRYKKCPWTHWMVRESDPKPPRKDDGGPSPSSGTRQILERLQLPSLRDSDAVGEQLEKAAICWFQLSLACHRLVDLGAVSSGEEQIDWRSDEGESEAVFLRGCLSDIHDLLALGQVFVRGQNSGPSRG